MKGRHRPPRHCGIAEHLDGVIFHWVDRHELWLERDARGTYVLKVLPEDTKRWFYLTDLGDPILGEEYEAWRFSPATINKLLAPTGLPRGNYAPRPYVETRDEEGRPLKIGFEP